MATISRYKLDGVEYQAPREFKSLEILATFDGDSVQANITTSEFSFVNSSVSKVKAAIEEWFSVYPTEGMPITISIENEDNTYGAFVGHLDFRTFIEQSEVELKCSIKQDNGLASLDERLRGITMRLLDQEGYFTPTDFSHIPYVVKNRKTILEKLYLLLQAYQIIKTGIDEIHKILNVASDIASLGIVIALINMLLTIANLIVLVDRLINLMQEIQESFFPPIRYHKGISLYVGLKRAVEYCGFTLNCGSFTNVISKIHLCPSKDDEIGETDTTNFDSGILKPGDFGFIASDLFALANKLCFTKVAIIGDEVHLKPFNDPYWIQNASYTMPSTLVEQAFVKNGYKTVNYDELKSSRVIEYTRDDSDLWTLTNVGDQISVNTVKPVTVLNQKRVLLTGSEQIKIPYALCVRNDIFDNLFDAFVGVSNGLEEMKEAIKQYFESVEDTLSATFPTLGIFSVAVGSRNGVVKVENHWFSTPKIVYLESDNRIPSNFASIIGAKALNENYHSYKSFVPGVRNPSNLSDTNSKRIFNDVSIPMGIDDFNTIISNSYFNVSSGGIGKFTSVKWVPDKDRALCSFYIQDQWATNITENTI